MGANFIIFNGYIHAYMSNLTLVLVSLSFVQYCTCPLPLDFTFFSDFFQWTEQWVGVTGAVEKYENLIYLIHGAEASKSLLVNVTVFASSPEESHKTGEVEPCKVLEYTSTTTTDIASSSSSTILHKDIQIPWRLDSYNFCKACLSLTCFRNCCICKWRVYCIPPFPKDKHKYICAVKIVNFNSQNVEKYLPLPRGWKQI